MHHQSPIPNSQGWACGPSAIYSELEHSYSEYCNLIGQGVVYKSHIDHVMWLIQSFTLEEYNGHLFTFCHISPRPYK